MRSTNLRNSNLKDDPYYKASSSTVRKRSNQRRVQKNNSTDFLTKERRLSNSIFFPDGLEEFMFGIYFLILPYLTGVFTVFIVVCKGSFDKLMTLSNSHSFLLAWSIGYEVLAFLTLLWVFKMVVFSSTDDTAYHQQQKKRHQRRNLRYRR